MHETKFKPPVPLPPGVVPEEGPRAVCEGCEGAPIPGIRWCLGDWSDGDYRGFQVVERCDACDRYDSDESAARVVAARYGFTAVHIADHGGSVHGCYGVINPRAPVWEPPPPKVGDPDALVNAGDLPREQRFLVAVKMSITLRVETPGEIASKEDLRFCLADNFLFQLRAIAGKEADDAAALAGWIEIVDCEPACEEVP